MQDPGHKTIKRQYTSGRPKNVLDADYFYYDTTPNNINDLAIVCGGHEKCASDSRNFKKLHGLSPNDYR